MGEIYISFFLFFMVLYMKTTVLLSSRNNQFNMQIYTLAVCCCSKGCEREDSGGVRGGDHGGEGRIRTKYNLMFNSSGKIEKFRMVPGSVNCSRFALSVSLKKNKIDLSTCSLHKRSPCNTVADTGIYCSAMHVLPAIFPLFKIDKDSWLKCYPWKLEWQSFMWLNIF